MRDIAERIIIAGFGGQGILLAGKLLAQTGMDEGYEVTWLPSYGPEMRGGTANCHVIISPNEIGAPVIETPDVVVVFNRPSLEKFESDVKQGGLVLYDNSLIDVKPSREDIKAYPVPATELADSLGSLKAANMVMIGAYAAASGTLTMKGVMSSLEKVISTRHRKMLDVNIAAIKKGAEVVEGAKEAEKEHG